MTHAGILLLLVGSLMSSLMGVDGQMMLFEGEKKDSIVQNTYELIVHQEPDTVTPIELKSGSRLIRRHFDSSAGPFDLTVHRVWDNAIIKTDIVNLPSEDINHAAELWLSSERTGVNEDVWLVENNPLDSESGRFSMGPAVFEIAGKPVEPQKTQTAAKPSQTARLRIFKKGSDLDFSIDLGNIPSGEIDFMMVKLQKENLDKWGYPFPH